MNKEQEKVTDEIGNLLESGASEAEIYANIEEFKEKFADYGRDRRSAIEFHLRNIERLLMPTQTTTIAMRALQGTPGIFNQQSAPTEAQQDLSTEDSNASKKEESTTDEKQSAQSATEPHEMDEGEHESGSAQQSATEADPSDTSATAVAAASSSSDKPKSPDSQDPKALFQYLVNHLEVTPEQAASLKDSRFVAQELDSHLEKALKVLEELKSRLTKCGEDLEAEFDNVRAILTPTQAAKFLIWVANNGACMHMLNELWSRAYGLSTDPLDAVPLEDTP